MKPSIVFFYVCCTLLCLLFFNACHPDEPLPETVAWQAPSIPPLANDEHFVTVAHDVAIADYFEFIDTLVNAWDSMVPHPLDEHLLVWANSWIIDSLAATIITLQWVRKLLFDTNCR
ncbi:MAG: hypothetical protein AAFR36_19550 [Bacteroidota bacterium]